MHQRGVVVEVIDDVLHGVNTEIVGRALIRHDRLNPSYGAKQTKSPRLQMLRARAS